MSEVRRLSHIPFESLASVFADKGAMRTISAQRRSYASAYRESWTSLVGWAGRAYLNVQYRVSSFLPRL